MLLSLLLALALQAKRGPAKDASRPEDMVLGIGETAHFADGVPVSGKLLFPADIPPRFVHIEMETPEGIVIDETKSMLSGEFLFQHVPLGASTNGVVTSAPSYFLVIIEEDIAPVRQALELTTRNFQGAQISIQLHHLPGVPDGDAEFAVNVESLKQPPSKDAVRQLDKALAEERRNDKSATGDLEKTVKMAPDYYEANLQLGLQYQRLDRVADARRVLEHAVALNPSSTKSYAALGEIYFSDGEFQKAADSLNNAVRLGSTAANTYFNLGSAYFKLGDMGKAEECLQRALLISPQGMGKAYVQLYNVYVKLKQLDKAMASLNTYVKKFPNAPDRDKATELADRLRKALNPG